MLRIWFVIRTYHVLFNRIRLRSFAVKQSRTLHHSNFYSTHVLSNCVFPFSFLMFSFFFSSLCNTEVYTQKLVERRFSAIYMIFTTPYFCRSPNNERRASWSIDKLRFDANVSSPGVENGIKGARRNEEKSIGKAPVGLRAISIPRTRLYLHRDWEN